MSTSNPSFLAPDDNFDLAGNNQLLKSMTAEARINWALQHLPGAPVVSSSFGIQSAVMLHLMNRLCPGIAVVLVDTGYLFAETYRFIDQLEKRLDLNLKVYSSQLSAAWHEARYGKLWLDGKSGIERYNEIHKVEPMRRALEDLAAGSWYAGLRRSQSSSRKPLPVLRRQQGRFKIHPLVDWRNRDVHRYIVEHDLPYHPLWEKGFQSVGDTHTSRPLEAGMSAEQSRFFGLTRECGLHI
ncbi:MAG: phosphoadenylyl-sulfate reductase [Gammaproteobacteria bacterium]|nr:phosphoadenylyl-sulfate reductase [Gammaproteobacteria bacterium]